ncbi:hypothetical protein ACFPRL_07500 [Pseudoclavibacter helvolus]
MVHDRLADCISIGGAFRPALEVSGEEGGSLPVRGAVVDTLGQAGEEGAAG